MFRQRRPERASVAPDLRPLPSALLCVLRVLCGFGFLLLASGAARAMLGGTDHSSPPAHLADVWGLTPDKLTKTYDVKLIGSTTPGNVLYPGEQTSLTFQIVNQTDRPIRTSGRVDLIQYALRTVGSNDLFNYEMRKIADAGSVPIDVNVAAKGFQNVTITPPVPARLGGYALIFDLGAEGRHLGTGVVRSLAQSDRPVQYPTMSLDERDPALLQRIGIHAVRFGIDYYPASKPDFEQHYADVKRKLDDLHKHNVTVLLMVGAGGPQPMVDRMRSFLNEKGEGPFQYPGDGAWLPSSDKDFSDFCARFAGQYGYPKGPITAFSLWNEPWEGSSISGWGADMLRYREIYTAMFHGVKAACKRDKVNVLVGGCDSSSNALDKLFGDADSARTFLPMFEFVSLHYQGLSCPQQIPLWRDRKVGTGRVLLWDTESWAANTDERVLPRLASWRAAGYDRLMGVDAANVDDEEDVEVRQADGSMQRYHAVHAWSVAASVGAVSRFLGNRPFKEFVFKNGLPWVMAFGGEPDANGKPGSPDDGTLVIAGDIGAGDKSLFRTVKLRKEGGTLTISASPEWALYDSYGNAVPSQNGQIVVPLTDEGFYLRPSNSAGAFSRLVAAVRRAKISGYDPVEIVAKDMTAPIAASPTLALRLTNVLNRPVTGTLTAKLEGLTLSAPSQSVTLGPNETRIIALRVMGGQANERNIYPLTAMFDAASDGTVTHTEAMHGNVIARRTIVVNGELDDWNGVLPQTITDAGTQGPSLTEQAWYPFKTFDASAKPGFGTGYLACDDNFFYFAAKIADDTPDAGTLRFANRDENADFYPQTSYLVEKDDKGATRRTALAWPEGVRRYTYQRDPTLPAGNGQGAFDNVQIAFNVIPESDVKRKGLYPFPPGTMPHYSWYKDTDYEYALNQVAPEYGGGTEIWRLLKPGMPRKHFYPRQPKSRFDGAVENGKLVMRRDGNTRIVECALPWSELPDVKRRLDAGQTVKFTFRVNDNKGPSYELAHDRSVSSQNGQTFHCDWVAHWSNELEFGLEKRPR